MGNKTESIFQKSIVFLHQIISIILISYQSNMQINKEFFKNKLPTTLQVLYKHKVYSCVRLGVNFKIRVLTYTSFCWKR